MRSKNKNRKLVVTLFLATLGMFAFGFALVPIYNTLCRTLGVNGKPNVTAVAYNAANSYVDTSRVVTVEFITTTTGNLPWKFYAKTHKITLHPGEMKRVAFYAENDSDHTMIVQAIPSITPGIAAKFFKKTECFCFTQQTLQSHEAMNMPLLFHLDPELPSNIKTLTLAYTLFDVTARASKNLPPKG